MSVRVRCLSDRVSAPSARRVRRLVGFLLVLILACPEVVDAQTPQTGRWDTRFSAPYMAPVSRLTIDDADRLFVFGDFHVFSGVTSENIVVYDGTDWSAIPGDNSSIVGIDRKGNVYETRPADFSQTDLFVWDGSNWEFLLRSPYSYMKAAARRDGSIILSTCSPPCVVRCSPRRGTPLQLFRDGETRTITDSMDCGNSLFRSIDDVVHNIIDGNTVRWDDSLGWVFEAGPIPTEWGSGSRRIIDARGTVYATATNYESSATLSLLRWADTAWVAIDLPELVTGVGATTAAKDGSLYISLKVGSSVIVYSFDGQLWTQLGGELTGGVLSLAIDSKGVLYAAGDLVEPESGAKNLVRLVDNRWEPFAAVGLGGADPFSDSTVGVYSSDDGRIFAQGALPEEGFWEFTGDAFSLVTDASQVNDVKKVRVTPDFFGVENWSDLDVPDCPEAVKFQYVDRVGGDLSDSTVYAFVRCMIDNDYRYEILVMQWVPPTWDIVGRIAVPAARYAVRVRRTYLHSNGDLYVSGEFTEVNGEPMYGIARWDGSRWNALGAGLVMPDRPSGYANRILEYGERLVVGGHFLKAGELDVGYIAAWNGSNWERFGHFNGEPFALAKHARLGLYAGGRFAFSDTRSTNNVAHWDGQAWEGLGEGVYGSAVSSIAFEDSTAVWFGGDFYRAGGVGSEDIARWIPDNVENPSDPDDPEQQTETALRAYPNPTGGDITVRFASVQAGEARVDLFDLTGKRVATLFRGAVAAEEPRSISASMKGLATGVYLLTARLPDGVQSRKIVYLGR